MKTTPMLLSELFMFPSIKGITEEFINKHPGNIPVYGGRMTETPIGFVEDGLQGVKYFSDCLAWNREGSIGYVFYHKHKFSTNDHQRPLILSDKYKNLIDLEYVRIVLQQLLLEQGFVWSKTAGKDKVKKMSIEIPINENGDLDIERQRELVKKYSLLEKTQTVLKGYHDRLKESIVVLDKCKETKTVYLSDDCFSLSIGKRILKKQLLDDGIPLYSANPNKIFGYIKKSNLSSFDLPSIIWGIDGIFEWGYIPQYQEFATTDHCGRLQVLDSNILSEYVYYQLRETTSLYGFNRTYRASLQNIKLVEIDIPINKNGDFDINAQSELIKKYREIDNIKHRLLNLLDIVVTAQVEV